jgi:predicted O-linked N-acetylglucosamine transferase (SPINDLY family)
VVRGTIHTALHDVSAAVEANRHAVRLQPFYPEAYNNLGTAYLRLNDVRNACNALETAVEQNPALADARYNLAVAYQLLGEFQKAIEANRESLRLRPGNLEAMNNLANLLVAHGNPSEALPLLEQALALLPTSPSLHNNLGNALLKLGELDRAIACFNEAVRLDPTFAEGFANAGVAFQRKGLLDEAIAAYRSTLKLQPAHTVSLNNLGSAYKNRGEIDEAIKYYRMASDTKPSDPGLYSNVLLTMHYRSGMTSRALLAEHLRWGERYARPLTQRTYPFNRIDRSPDRKLRVGYLSSDLNMSAVGQFFLPILAHHDRSAIHSVCYADMPMPDAFTSKLKETSDEWRFVTHSTDDEIADQIRQDNIDILVDLTLHTARSRITALARKPAPVQCTYLAYCSTSGMEQVDYRISDPWLDPPGSDLGAYTEETVFLPETYWCYPPPFQDADVTPSPEDARGHVTFGCLNNFCKVSTEALEAFAQVVVRTPHSRLLLHTFAGSHRDRILSIFSRAGADAPQVEFIDFLSTENYFKTYQRIDIALDSFPFNGGTTTCDALWMGVPVVTLSGAIPVARAGVSLLSNAGLTSLIAHSVDEYIQIATALAADRPRLRALRAGLREQMLRSPLMNSERFTRNLELAYRKMWHTWCGTRLLVAGGASSTAE